MSVTGPAGFRAAGVPAGIKPGGALDLALVVNEGPDQVAAGVFTENQVQAAPVLWSREVLRAAQLRAVVLNSGGANACTGPEGFQDAHATAEKVAETLGVGAVEVGVCSTGLIGERLPMHAVLSGAESAAQVLDAGERAGTDAATAVLTTDSRPKQAHRAAAGGWSVGGFAKGSGMLAPNMATMLGVLTTDAVLDAETLDAALRSAAGRTFHRLDVDGGTSTNDTVLVLASGASGVRPDAAEFTELLTATSNDLVRELQADAEGATKMVDITVRNARSEQEAVHIGRVIAEDNLVKTALFGSDPNWGRIAMALGRAGVPVEVGKVEITVNGVRLFAGGTQDRDRGDADLSGGAVEIVIDLQLGDAEATILSTDLSHAYVEENSAYSS